jgi:PleD family two-component response regulator
MQRLHAPAWFATRILWIFLRNSLFRDAARLARRVLNIPEGDLPTMSASAWSEVCPRLLLAPAPVHLLTVGIPDSDFRELSRFLAGPDCHIQRASARHEVLSLVQSRCPDVVICEPVLPDGTWQDLLCDLQCLPHSPMLIVSSLWADDRLWAEVLNIGGYDVLMKPFHHDEVIRVVNMAARQVSWKKQRG